MLRLANQTQAPVILSLATPTTDPAFTLTTTHFTEIFSLIFGFIILLNAIVCLYIKQDEPSLPSQSPAVATKVDPVLNNLQLDPKMMKQILVAADAAVAATAANNKKKKKKLKRMKKKQQQRHHRS